MADSIINLKVKDNSFNAQIKEAARTFADFGKRVSSAGVDAFGDFAKGTKTAKVAFEGFNAALKANALVLVASLAVEAASAIGSMIGDWISDADDAADAQARLNEKLDETKRLVDSINSEGDFNARLAKAAGASTSEVLKMKAATAQKAMNTAMGTLMDPNVKVGTEEYDRAKKMYEVAEKQYQKALQDIKVDETARQYGTGEYASRKTGAGRSKGISVEDSIRASFDKAMLKGYANAASLKPDDVLGPSDAWTAYTEAMKNGLDGVGDSMSNLTQWTKDFDPYADKMKELATLAKQQQMAFDMAAQSAGSLGQALASIEDPGAKAAGTVIEAIASIALGFAQASVQASSMGPWGWLAFLAAGAAAMVTTISTVHSLTGYAEGGIIKGNTYSGDQIYAGSGAMVNAGELVLTRAQQGNLASQLQGGGMQNLQMSATISGEQIRLALNNNSRRRGKGEYVTSNFM